jgi:hypothetical protein
MKPRLVKFKGEWLCSWRGPLCYYFYGRGGSPLEAYQSMCADIARYYTRT